MDIETLASIMFSILGVIMFLRILLKILSKLL